jgi:hypothetical protein
LEFCALALSQETDKVRFYKLEGDRLILNVVNNAGGIVGECHDSQGHS